MAEYQPGVCNINQEGVAYRRRVSVIAMAMAAFVLVVAVLSEGAMLYLLAFAGFAVLFIGVLNWLQAKNTFCASHGMSGTQQVADGADGPEEVTDDISLAKDKQRSKIMMAQSALVAAGVALAAIVLSSVV